MKPHKYQIWKNNAPQARFFMVSKEADAFGCVEIISVCRSNDRLSLPKNLDNGRLDYASVSRFDGKAGNYSFVAANLKTFNDKKLGLIHFARTLSKYAPVTMAATAPVIDLGTLTITPVPDAGPLTGEIWRELKGSHMRYVQVIGDKAEGKVRIVTRYFTDVAGARPQATPQAKPTFAQEGRFNGVKGGYEFVSNNLTELMEQGLLQRRFVPTGETLENVMQTAFPAINEGQLWHDLSQTTCFHLVEVVGVNGDEIEIATNYVANADSKAAAKMVRGKSVIIPIDAFAHHAPQFNLIKAA